MTARPLGTARSAVRTDETTGAATARGMALLRAGVPLSLLVDLACGPRSHELLAWERPASARG